MATDIHPTAIIDPTARIGEGVTVGAYSIIGPGVVLGDNVRVHPHVVIERDTELGEGCEIFPFASIGTAPQDLKYTPERITGVRIGPRSIIHECATVHRASLGGDGLTEMGSECFIMAYAHVAHDCKLGNNVIMANGATLAGHVTIGDHAFISGLVVVHQFIRIGTQVMVGGMSRIVKDAPPYSIVQGADSVKFYGINKIGLERRGFSADAMKEIERAYGIIAKKGTLLSDALRRVQEELPYTDEVRTIVEFFSSSGKRRTYR